MSFWSVQQFFRSISVARFISPRLQRYFRGILYTYFESIWLANSSFLSSIFASVLNASLLLLLFLLFSLLGIITVFLLYKRSFSIIFREFFSKCLNMVSEYLCCCWDKGVICPIFRYVNLPYLVSKKIVYWINISI